jgi:hypothetical protein
MLLKSQLYIWKHWTPPQEPSTLILYPLTQRETHSPTPYDKIIEQPLKCFFYLNHFYLFSALAISAVEVDFRENDQENNYSGDVEKVTFPSKRLLYVDDAIELYKNDVAAYGQVKITDL